MLKRNDYVKILSHCNGSEHCFRVNEIVRVLRIEKYVKVERLEFPRIVWNFKEECLEKVDYHEEGLVD